MKYSLENYYEIFVNLDAKVIPAKKIFMLSSKSCTKNNMMNVSDLFCFCSYSIQSNHIYLENNRCGVSCT